MVTRSSAAGPDRPTLLDLTSRPDFDAGVSSIVRQIGPAASEADAIDLIAMAAVRLGADCACFASCIQENEAQASYRYLLACDPLWATEYVSQRWFEEDPWLAYAMDSSDPVRARDVKLRSSGQGAMVRAAAERGFRSAVIVPAPSARGGARTAALYLGSHIAGYYDGDGFMAVKIAAYGLAMELNAWWFRRARERLRAEARITEADLQLLRFEQQGHGSKVIAAALQTEAKTIDCRFSRLSARLGVANRRGAVRLARLYELI